MKKDFMSPKCFLNAKHNAVSPKGFGENGFDRPKMDVGDAQKLLESLKKNGLEGEDERALDIEISGETTPSIPTNLTHPFSG